MTTAISRKGRGLTLRQQKGRAVNAVAEVLQKKLMVPNIYLEPHIGSLAVDVLAVDRAGAGDLHAVEVKLESEFPRNPAAALNRKLWMLTNVTTTIKSMHGQLLPAHYRYLAIPKGGWDLSVGELGPHLYASDGIGRIGIITITDRGDDPPTAEIVIAPERFRVDAAKLSKIERDVINNKKVRPDIEVRI
jgi:hypothetical protein